MFMLNILKKKTYILKVLFNFSINFCDVPHYDVPLSSQIVIHMIPSINCVSSFVYIYVSQEYVLYTYFKNSARNQWNSIIFEEQ